MVNKAKKFLLIFSFIFVYVSAWSQENYYIQDTEDGAIFIQKFSWEQNPDVLKYEFTIEKQNKKGKYELIQKVETEQNFVEVSLSSGHYRYKLVLYNFLSFPEYETEWFPVDVIKAYQPKISDISPSSIYLEEEQDGLIVVNGYELRPETEFVLKSGTKEIYPEKVTVDSNNKKVKLYFNPNSFDSGNFTLIAKNIGGLKFEYKSLKIQFKKAKDFDISGGYSFIWIPGDSTFMDYFKTSISGKGLALRTTFIPFKHKQVYYGFSLNLFNFYYANSLDKWDLSTFFTISSLDFDIQIPFNNKMFFLDFHLGAGLTTFYDIHFEFAHNIKSTPMQSISPNINAGLEFIIYPTKRLYFTIATDYTLTINFNLSNSDKIMFMSAIIPTLEIGYQF